MYFVSILWSQFSRVMGCQLLISFGSLSFLGIIIDEIEVKFPETFSSYMKYSFLPFHGQHT